jgi:ubiquinone/menaquinone biosynthesis C-methylase UbiE
MDITDMEKEIQQIQRKLKAWCSKTAYRYDLKPSESNFNREFSSFQKIIKIKKGERILDIATGTGLYLLEEARRGAICYGIDLTPKMLEQLNKKIAKTSLKKQIKSIKIGKAEKLDYPKDYFDWVTCIGMLEYYPMSFVKRVLNEIKRVLKNKGKAIIDFPDATTKEAYGFKRRENSVGNKFYLYKLDFIKKNLEKHNFKILKIRKAGFQLQFLLEKI